MTLERTYLASQTNVTLQAHKLGRLGIPWLDITTRKTFYELERPDVSFYYQM